jgi:hypothetical protein
MYRHRDIAATLQRANAMERSVRSNQRTDRSGEFQWVGVVPELAGQTIRITP